MTPDPRALAERHGLSFHLEQRVPDHLTLVYHEDGCRPATNGETQLWTALARYALDREAAEESSRFHQERARQAEEEVERLRARLDRAAPHICPDCGPHARVDTEGCCVSCGVDTYFASDPHASPAPRVAQRQEDDDGR